MGIGLTIDEFALWLYLEDVYWADRGRQSVDALVIAVSSMGLILLGVRPFDVDDATTLDLVGSIAVSLLILGCVVVCVLKSRLLHATLGFFIAPLAVYGAARIGKPDSSFARRRYGDPDSPKHLKAARRFHPGRRTERTKERFRDLVGGSTDEQYQLKLAGRG